MSISTIDRKYFIKNVQKLKKDTKNEISCCCPLCGDTKDRLHLVYVAEGDYNYVKCFNEGCDVCEPTSVFNFLKFVNPADIDLYKREKFKTTITQLKDDVSLQNIINSVESEKSEPIKEQSLPLDKLFLKANKVPECINYLKQRNIEVRKDWYFSKNKFFEHNNKKIFLKNYIIIPIYNTLYQYKGFYSRSIEEKKFSTFLLPDTEKIWIKNPKQTPDIITEGVFDALSTGFNNPAAMLGASLSDKYVKTLSKKTTIATDNDDTGIRKAKYFLDKGFNVFVWGDKIEKDFNEMLQNYTTEQIKQYIIENTYSGLMGKVKLGIKEK